MSMLSAQRDTLRKVAGELQSIIDGLNKGHVTYDSLMDTLDYSILCLNGAADTIWQLRNDCVDLRMENEKLRNLMQRRVKDYMYESCGDCWGGLCDECQCWVSECADELRELGIEVSNDD